MNIWFASKHFRWSKFGLIVDKSSLGVILSLDFVGHLFKSRGFHWLYLQLVQILCFDHHWSCLLHKKYILTFCHTILFWGSSLA
jgi:hypothetical protein